MEYEGEDVDQVFGLTFQVTYSDVFGELQECSLKKDGDTIPVTKDNMQVSLNPFMCTSFNSHLQEYVDLYTDWLLSKSIEVQFKAFKKGFDVVIHDTNLVELFRPEEVELLVCGSKVSYKFDIASVCYQLH